MHLIPLLALTLLLTPGQQAAHKPSDEIDEVELREYLAKQNECEPDQIYFWTTEEYDFLGVGYDQTVVVASTCMTGTAGPDVHSVYTRDDDGELRELEFEVPDLRKYPVLFGNSNSDFSLENGLWVDTYHDTSGRDHPLVIKYKWDKDKQKFEAVKIEAAKPYPTSYDCAKAEKDTEQAICYVESLADLDVELAKTYRAYLAGMDAESRKQAVEEQRTWLAKRNKECVIYKFWVECLEDSYKTRIAELQRKIEERKKAQPATSLIDQRRRFFIG